MSQLHGTQASCDPLSASAADETAVRAGQAPLPVPAMTGSAATQAGGIPASEDSSFMTARSNMSYMTSSAQSAAPSSHAPPHPAAALSGTPEPVPPNPFYRLPDRDTPLASVPPAAPSPRGPTASGGPLPFGDSLSDRYNPFCDSPAPRSVPPAQAALAADHSNPFASPLEPYPSVPQSSHQPPSTRAATAAASLGPLCFGDDAGGGRGVASNPATAFATGPDAAFSSLVDLYDTPETFAQPQPVAASVTPPPAAAPTPAPLPPLADFTRDFSRMLPVSDDPGSPPAVSSVASPGWYDSGSAAAGAGPSYPGGGVGGSAGGGAALYDVGPGGASGSSGGGVLMSYAAAALLTNTVSIHSPRKAVVPSRIPGLSEPYTVYRVTSRGATVSETTVDRRFRDVVALAELLQALYPGCFVPPRPSRNAVEARRMQPAFIEDRRLGMEKFLKRLVVHAVFGPSEALQVWLRSPTPDLRTAPEWLRLQPLGPPGLARSTARLLFQVVGRERTVPSPLEATRPASERGDMYRMVHERAAQLRGVLSKAQPSPAEERLRTEAAALHERSESLLVLSRRADHLVSRGAKSAGVAGDLATALGALAAADEAGPRDGPSPLAALQRAAEGCSKVGTLYNVANDASAKHLTPLHEWLAAVPGAAAGLAARERCLLTVATLEADEREGRARLAEAEARSGAGGGGGVTSPAAAKKVEGLRLQVSQLAAAAGAARDEYERVGGRNAAEMAAFKAHMSRELADAVREFALVQLAAAQKAHEIWRETAAALVQLAAAAAAPPPGGASVGSGVNLGFGLGASRGGSSNNLAYGGTPAY